MWVVCGGTQKRLTVLTASKHLNAFKIYYSLCASHARPHVRGVFGQNGYSQTINEVTDVRNGTFAQIIHISICLKIV